jgi:hypothetical protein
MIIVALTTAKIGNSPIRDRVVVYLAIVNIVKLYKWKQGDQCWNYINLSYLNTQKKSV